MLMNNYHVTNEGISIAQKIESFATLKGMSKSKMGEILGTSRKASVQAKVKKYDTFLNSIKNSKINLKKVGLIAEYFDKPLAFFLSGTGTLSQNSKTYESKSPITLDDVLMAEGLDEEEREIIKKHMALMKKKNRKI